MMKFVLVASHLAIGLAIRVDTSAEHQDEKHQWITDIATAAEDEFECPCVNATGLVDLYIEQQFSAVQQCISLYSTSGSTVTAVSSGDASGVAQATGAKILSDHMESVPDFGSIEDDVAHFHGQFPYLRSLVLGKVGDCKTQAANEQKCTTFAKNATADLVVGTLAAVKSCSRSYARLNSNVDLVVRSTPTNPSYVPTSGGAFDVLLNKGWYTMQQATAATRASLLEQKSSSKNTQRARDFAGSLMTSCSFIMVAGSGFG